MAKKQKVVIMQHLEKQIAETSNEIKSIQNEEGTHERNEAGQDPELVQSQAYRQPQRPEFYFDPVSPLSNALQASSWPIGYKPTSLPMYDGQCSPKQFPLSYEATVQSFGGDSSVMAKSLIMALQGVAQRWYTSLPPRSINSWYQLKQALILNFQGFCVDPVTTQTLFACKQQLDEPFYQYFQRFLNIKAQAAGVSDEVVIDAAINGLCIGQCTQYFARKRPRSVQELFKKIEKFCRVDSDLRLRQADQNRDRRGINMFEGLGVGVWF